MVTEKSFNTGEITLNYAEEVTSGQPIVLLHGATRWWHDWEKLMPMLTSHWHPYAVDLRGHGKSGRQGENYRLNDYTHDIVSFLRGEVAEPAVLLGHSLGALTAITAAAQAPERVRAIVLVDPALFMRNNTLSAMPYVEFWFKLVYELTTTIHTYDEMLAKVREYAQPGDDEAELERRATVLMGLAPEMAKVVRENRLFEGVDIEQALKQITCPVLLIHGDWDLGGAMREEDVVFLKDCVPTARVFRAAGIGHDLDDHPDIILRELQTFFQTA